MEDAQTCPHTACAMYVALQEPTDGAIVVRTAAARKFRLSTTIQCKSPLVLHQNLTKKARAMLLIGMPGSGKTTLCTRLHGIDADHRMIEEQKKQDLPEVIATFSSSDAFIDYEGRTNISLIETHAIVSSGGSAIHSDALRAYLMRTNDVLVVWLSRTQYAYSDWSARGVVVPSDVHIATPDDVSDLRVPLYRSWADVELKTDVWGVERSTQCLRRMWDYYHYPSV